MGTAVAACPDFFGIASTSSAGHALRRIGICGILTVATSTIVKFQQRKPSGLKRKIIFVNYAKPWLTKFAQMVMASHFLQKITKKHFLSNTILNVKNRPQATCNIQSRVAARETCIH
jgi:hypothetical protein